MNKLKDIIDLVALQMDAYTKAREHLTGNAIQIVKDINADMVKNSGKQLRPLLVFLTAACCGMTEAHPNANKAIMSAVAMETLHNSTLIHDDVVDESDLRRGRKTLNIILGNKAAVLVGDYYLSRVMCILNNINNQDVTAAAENTINLMSQGELIQLMNTGNQECTEEIYFQIIGRKTASFISECCHIGAILATPDTQLREAARLYGKNLGIAFQIRDDIIDYLPSSRTGKPQGNDIKEHKFTLPLILALQHCDYDTKRSILSLFGKDNPSTSETNKIIEAVTSCKGIELANNQMNQYLQKAADAAKALPKNKYQTALVSLTEKLQDF